MIWQWSCLFFKKKLEDKKQLETTQKKYRKTGWIGMSDRIVCHVLVPPLEATWELGLQRQPLVIFPHGPYPLPMCRAAEISIESRYTEPQHKRKLIITRVMVGNYEFKVGYENLIKIT